MSEDEDYYDYGEENDMEEEEVDYEDFQDNKNANNNNNNNQQQQDNSGNEIRNYKFVLWKQIFEEVLTKDIQNKLTELLQLDFDKCLLIYQHYFYNKHKLENNIFNEMDKINQLYGLQYQENNQISQFENQECPNCFGDEGKSSKLPCGHMFCDECLSTYMTFKVTQNIVFIPCMQEGCNYYIRHSVFLKIMDQKVYLKKLVANFAEKSKEIVQCPGNDCKFMLVNPQQQFQYVECDCQKRFCSKCIGEIHQPAPCEMLVSWKKQTDQDDLNLKWIASNAKVCPTCKKAVQRSLGCDYMYCAPPGGCGSSFCYSCEKVLTEKDHGAHASCRNKKQSTSQEEKQNAQDILKKVNHFYDKFKTCEVVQEKARNYLEENLEHFQNIFFNDLEVSLAETQFISQSLKVLINSRDVLKYSYVFSFHLKPDQEKTKELFQFYQMEYEKQTEALAMSFEIGIKKIIDQIEQLKNNKNIDDLYLLKKEFYQKRTEMVTITQAVKKAQGNMIEAVELGTIYID